jgi:CRP/FNR family cyclic AMP-dependent transcriptional regulator
MPDCDQVERAGHALAEASGVSDLSIFVSDTDVQAHPAGHHFFEVGQSGGDMYVVLEGTVVISLRGRILEHVGPGGVFGEMAMIDNRERSADVVAETDVRVAPMDQKRFLYLIRNHPFFAIEVMKIMTDRLRRFDDLL